MTESDLSFGTVRLSPKRRALSRDGVPIKLSSRGFDLLLALLERPGELVTRRELIDQVWRGRVVEDANLAVQVSQLRQRLGADGNAPNRAAAFASSAS